jgi:hypothetical protein
VLVEQRFAQPALHAFSEAGEPMRLIQQTLAKDDDADPKALCAYGMLVRSTEPDGEADERVLLRFVDGRPVSSITTTRFLDWSCQRLQQMGKYKALLLIWDNASWHKSHEVQDWIASHLPQQSAQGRWERSWSAHRSLPASHEKSVAQPDRADVDPRQAQSRRARWAAWRL